MYLYEMRDLMGFVHVKNFEITKDLLYAQKRRDYISHVSNTYREETR